VAPERSIQIISYRELDVDDLVAKLQASRPEILVVAGSFEQEIQISPGAPTLACFDSIGYRRSRRSACLS
jgi:hypothetical protein